VGLFRVPIPNYDRRAFREAFINALVHRDYSRLGAVHVRLDDDGLTLSSPGGFVEGITLHNLLVAAPRSRNPMLAYIDKHGSIKRGDVIDLCRISGPQAYHLLKRLKEQGKIRQKGEKRHAV